MCSIRACRPLLPLEHSAANSASSVWLDRAESKKELLQPLASIAWSPMPPIEKLEPKVACSSSGSSSSSSDLEWMK